MRQNPVWHVTGSNTRGSRRGAGRRTEWNVSNSNATTQSHSTQQSSPAVLDLCFQHGQAHYSFESSFDRFTVPSATAFSKGIPASKLSSAALCCHLQLPFLSQRPLSLSNMTVQPKSLLAFQVYLEENPGLPDQLSGFAFAVHRDSSTLMSAADLKGREATSASALSDIIMTMYSSVLTRWSIASLVGPLLPAGFLVPVRGKLATDPIHLRYIVAATFVGTKKDHYPANPSHLVAFSGQEVFSRGDDLDGTGWNYCSDKTVKDDADLHIGIEDWWSEQEQNLFSNWMRRSSENREVKF